MPKIVAVPILFSLLLISLSAATLRRNALYKDEFTLWHDAVRKSPGNSRAHNNLGRAYEKKKMFEVAAGQYLESVRLNPYYAPSHSNLAVIYYGKGMLDYAENALRTAIRYGPAYEDLRRRLGFVYLKKGLKDEAVKEFAQALRLIPNHESARMDVAIRYNEEGFSYIDEGDFQNALILHKVAQSLVPDYANAHYGLALAYEGMGIREDSIRHWEEYLRLTPLDEPFRKDAERHLKRLRSLSP